MLKIIGSVAVILSGGAIGIMKQCQLSCRVSALEKTRSALLHIQSSIAAGNVSLGRSFAESGHPVLKRAAEYGVESGMSEGLALAVKEADMPLEEREILTGFASGLCATDREGQLKNIELCDRRIYALLQLAADRKEKLSRLYAASGLLGGAAVVLIFL